MLPVTAAQLPLFDEPLLYHSTAGRAYFGALVLTGGRPLHACHPVEELPTWLRLIDPRRDTFVSQAQFSRPQRRIAALRSIGLLWADLGDDGELGQHGDAWAVQRVLDVAEETGIPCPSLIVSTGRGYHAKWLFEKGVPWLALDRWAAVEREIVARLRGHVDADQRATDAARVLRVVGTMNSRTGELARIVWTNKTTTGDVMRYGFDTLADEVFPFRRASHHERHGKALRTAVEGRQRATRAHYTVGSLWWSRYRDIRRLCTLRGWTAGNGGVPEGYRDQVLFLGSVALSWIARPSTWWGEVESLAADFTPSLRESEWRTYVGTAYRRLVASSQTDKPETRYRYSTARIVRDLDISREEMAKLEVLLDPDLVRERKLLKDRERVTEFRRARGVVERGTYRAIVEERAQEIRRLIAEGLSQREVAEKLAVSRDIVRYVMRFQTES